MSGDELPASPAALLSLLDSQPPEQSLTAFLVQRGWEPAAASDRLAEAADELVHQDAPQAHRLARAALEMAGQQARPEVTARALRSVVQSMAMLGQFEAALPLSLQAYELYQAAGLGVQATRTLLGRTHLLASLGRYDEALAASSEARATFQAAGEDLLAAVAQMNLGNVHQRLDQYVAALEQYEQATQSFERLNAENWLAQARFNLGNALTHLNRPHEASQAYERARAYFQAHDQLVTAAMLDCNLGFLDLRRCRYTSALQQFHHARETFEALEMSKDVVQMEVELANTYLDLNLLAEAAEKFQRAAATFDALGLRYEAGCALAQLALAEIRQGQFAAAESALDEALERLQHESPAWLHTCQIYTALLHQARGEFGPALTAAVQAAQGLAEAGLEARRASAYLIAASVSMHLQKPQAVDQYLAKAAEDLSRVDMPTAHYHLEHWRGRQLLGRGDENAALLAFEAAMTDAERVYATLPGDVLRVAYREDKLGAYEAAAALLLAASDTGQLARAFNIVERAKALALVERLEQRPMPTIADAGVTGELEALRSRLNWYYSAYTHGPPESAPVDRTALRQEIHAAERELEELLRRHTLLSRNPFAAGTAAVIPLAEVQSRLEPDQAILEYFIAGEEVLAMVISRAKVRTFRGLAQTERVASVVGALRWHFQRFAFGAEYARRHMQQLHQSANEHLRTLHKLLVAPLAGSLPARVIVVPHGLLHYVPFHALFDGRDYLVRRHLITYAPSATVWVHCQSLPAAPVKSPLVVAVSDSSIPFAAAEADILRELYPEARVCSGPDATWANLRQHARGADLLHVASHAVFRSDNVQFSALQMADAWVTVNDLADLWLPPALVVLTGCETGVSRVAPGDEMMGLGRAFLGAGAASLAVSAWAVHDESAALWVWAFYHHLQKDPSPAAAMRAAQLEVMADHPHPYYWAPFMVIGRS